VIVDQAEHPLERHGPSAFPGRYGDRLVALSAALLTLFVYLTTMYPGLFGMGDAAKFAFVGKVLGIPHAPGYPLYVALSHLFSYVPWGTLAHRMNGLSALLAALAVAFVYFGARALGLERAVAVSTALAFGFGRAFWSKALYAKGYTLNAALVAAGIMVLLEWGQTRRPLHLYVAIGIFALGVGNHLIIISLLPALIVYALATDARTALAPRTLFVTAGLVAAGLSQYLLIVLRTWQHAPYLEAQASNLSELRDVMLARRWAQEIVAYHAGHLVAVRLPRVSGLVKMELTVAGLCLAAAGLLVLVRRRPPEAALCFLGALGVFALTSNMGSAEDEGFLLPAFVLLWLLAGTGLQWVIDVLRRAWTHAGLSGERWAPAVTTLAVAAVLPSSLLIGNYRANDHHNRTFEIRYFDALFGMLPDKSAIVDDRYAINMMVKYKLLGEGAAGGRDIANIPPAPDSVNERLKRGYRVFAFDDGRGRLERLGYQFEPVQLFDTPLPQYLDLIPDRWTVALAATPDVAAQLRANSRGWARLGVSTSTLFGQKVGAPLAILGVAGTRGAAMESIGAPRAALSVPAGGPIGGTAIVAGASISVTADRDQAVVSIDGIERVRTGRGVAVVLVDPRGGIGTYTLDGSRDLRVPFDMRAMPLFRVTGTVACNDVGNAGWQDISGAAARQMAIRIDNYRPFLSTTTLYLAGESPAAPQLTEVGGRGVPRMSVQTFRTADAGDRERLRQAALTDHLETLAALAAGPFVSRVELAVNDEGDYRAMRVDFGVVPTRTFVRATVDLNNPRRATVCGISPVPQDP
jgi:hypothetical protein